MRNGELNRLVYLGWPLIRWVNKWFYQYLRLVVRLGSKHGYCIVTDDLDCKAVVFPATWKTYISSAKMQCVETEIDGDQ